MPAISTCLIEKNVFFREGLKSLLAETDFHIKETYLDCDVVETRADDGRDIALVIMGIEDCADGIQKNVSSVKATFPKSRIVILTMQKDSDCITAAFVAGVDGYLLRDVSPPALLGYLNMVMVGEKVCPTAMLNMFVEDTTNINSAESVATGHRLSGRETQVLKYLAGGDTNKQIARDLDIAEATVKVHIKTVLRKLNLCNRTQAAVWAVNKGLTNHDSSARQTV